MSLVMFGCIVSFSHPMPPKGVKPQHEGTVVRGQRKYRLTVNEGNDSTVSAFNRGLDSIRNNSSNRNFMTDLAGLYKSTAAGQAISLSTSLIDLGVNTIISATKSKRPEWEKAVRGESTFIRKLPMQMEILDFYRSPSLNGPLDPTGLNFNGFGCQQDIEYTDGNGNIRVEPVFYVSCRVKADAAGRARMLHHSKFEVEVDSIFFNYGICDLPNDSLGIDTDKRIDFSFENRRDLKFIVDANITSSWINQALMVFNDQHLGSFKIVASINPAQTKDGIFTYSIKNKADSVKDVRVSGDCFLVPRSYVGSSDMTNVQDSWGTGQYKVEMTVTETCELNDSYYKTDGNWDSSKWKPEWRKIKSRRRTPSAWKQVWSAISNQYTGDKWVTILIDPAKTTFIQYETNGINRLINPGATITSAASASATGGQKQYPQQEVAGGQQPPKK